MNSKCSLRAAKLLRQQCGMQHTIIQQASILTQVGKDVLFFQAKCAADRITYEHHFLSPCPLNIVAGVIPLNIHPRPAVVFFPDGISLIFSRKPVSSGGDGAKIFSPARSNSVAEQTHQYQKRVYWSSPAQFCGSRTCGGTSARSGAHQPVPFAVGFGPFEPATENIPTNNENSHGITAIICFLNIVNIY